MYGHIDESYYVYRCERESKEISLFVITLLLPLTRKSHFLYIYMLPFLLYVDCVRGSRKFSQKMSLQSFYLFYSLSFLFSIYLYTLFLLSSFFIPYIYLSLYFYIRILFFSFVFCAQRSFCFYLYISFIFYIYIYASLYIFSFFFLLRRASIFPFC